MTFAVQNMVKLLGWLADACKGCPRKGTHQCDLCASYDAGNILEQYRRELATSASGDALSESKARFMCVLATLFKVEAAREEVSQAIKLSARSRKVGNAHLKDFVSRGFLELSEDGATVALTPLGLEFARAHTEKSKEGKGKA